MRPDLSGLEGRRQGTVASAERRPTIWPTEGPRRWSCGLNAARLFSLDVNAKRNELQNDYLSRMKMSYLEDGGPARSHRWYGWVAS